MAGITGAPSGTKPSDLAPPAGADIPVPEAPPGGIEFDPSQPFEAAPSAAPAPTQGAAPSQEFDPNQPFEVAGAPAPEKPGYAAQLGEATLQNLPGIGAVVGGALGTAGGPLAPATIPGAAAFGAATGAALKQGIESFLGRGQKSLGENAAEIGTEAVKGMTAEMGGQIVGKGLSAAGNKLLPLLGEKYGGIDKAATKAYRSMSETVQDLAGKTNGDMATAADLIRSDYQAAIKEAQGKLEDPALQIIARRVNTASGKEAGDVVKQKVTDEVQKKYGPIKEAYSQLEDLSRMTPVDEEARYQFARKNDGWIQKNFPQNTPMARELRKWNASIEASTSGQQLESVTKDLADAQNAAYQAGQYNKSKVLGELKGKANTFYEDTVSAIAERIKSGKGTPADLEMVSQMMEKRGVAGHPEVVAKQVADGYLSAKKSVAGDYKGFKKFLDNVSDQTGASGDGAMTFLKSLDEMPSEKLVSNVNKLFEKDIATLQEMKRELPDAYEPIAGYRIKNLADDAMKDGQLDVPSFIKSVKELPKEARALLFSEHELKQMDSLAADKKYEKLQSLVSNVSDQLIKPGTNYNSLVAAGRGSSRGLKDLGELSLLTGTNMVRDAQALSALEHFGKSPDLFSRAGQAATAIKATNMSVPPPVAAGAAQITGRGAQSLGQSLLPQEKRK